MRVSSSEIRPLSAGPEAAGGCEEASGSSRIRVLGGPGAFVLRLWPASPRCARLKAERDQGMSPLKERAKQLIEQMPDEAVARLIEDLEDALELRQALAEEGDAPGVPLEEFVKQLQAEGKLP